MSMKAGKFIIRGVCRGNHKQLPATRFRAASSTAASSTTASSTTSTASAQHSTFTASGRHRPRLCQLHTSERTAMSTTMSRSSLPLHGPQPQAVDAPLTKSATFLIVNVNSTPGAVETVRSVLAGIDGLAKNVSFRDLGSVFACTVGTGSAIWDSLTGLPRPAELRPFPVIRGAVHTAVSTPGDLLFHIRADRRDICFEFERQLLNLLGSSVLVAAEEDAPSAGGSYVVAQKYVHDVKRWTALPTENQEAIIGRTKLDNTELDDAPPGQQRSHKTLTTVRDEEGVERDILRDNMPFGSPGEGVLGTYFIAYSRRLWVVERMLERMFVGDPPGKHDRLLDYSRPLTGATFFAPSAAVLASL